MSMAEVLTSVHFLGFLVILYPSSFELGFLARGLLLLLYWFWYCSSNFSVCSFFDTFMLDLFSAATCSADFVLGVRLCFWVGHSGFYSLGSLLPLSLLLQFKVGLLCCDINPYGSLFCYFSVLSSAYIRQGCLVF